MLACFMYAILGITDRRNVGVGASLICWIANCLLNTIQARIREQCTFRPDEEHCALLTDPKLQGFARIRSMSRGPEADNHISTP